MVSAYPAQNVNLVTSLLAALIALYVFIQTRRWRTGPRTRWFAALTVAVGWVAICYALESRSGSDIRTYVLFCKLEYLGLTFIPLLWLNFALTFSWRARSLSPTLNAALALFPLLTIALAFTNDAHGLIWKVARFESGQYGPVFAPIYGMGFWAYALYAYSLFLAGTVVLFQQVAGNWRLFRAQAVLVLVGTALPWISNVMHIFDSLNPVPELAVNPIFLSLSMAAFGFGLFRLQLLDILPLARETILANVPAGLVVVDSAARVVAVNRSALPYLDSPESDPIGKPVGSVFAFLADCCPSDGGRYAPQERPVNGRVVEVNVAPVIDRQGTAHGHVFILSDVTARVEAQEALEEREYRYRMLFEQNHDAVCLIGLDGTTLKANARTVDLLGYGEDEWPGMCALDLLAPEERESSRTLFCKALAGEQIPVSERVFIRKDGSRLVAEVTISLIRDRYGKPLHVQVILHDVSERKAMEERALALALEQERVRLLSRFIQDTSHEFRTPLAVIQTSLYLMNKAETPDVRQQKASQIEAEIARINRLLESLVTMSHLDSGVTFDFQPTDINRLVSQVADRVEPTCRQAGIEICRELDPALPLIDANPDHFTECLRQIVDNALRFSTDGGTIYLRTRQGADSVIVEVEDTGIGIPADALPHIFERFYRLDHAHSTPGFGLGLAMAERIVAMHNGHIAVTSEVGHGSRFTITLPIRQSAGVEAPAAEAIPA